MENLEKTQIEVILDAYARGLRSNNLGEQPAPWMLHGLKILESGGKLTEDAIATINRSGGTDHPDPWFG